MVLWELWEKKRPFDELTSRFDIIDAIRAGHRPPISEDCPHSFRSLMQRCWQVEPARRPTFHYIERYIKDELARVRRQRFAAMRPAGDNFLGRLTSSDRSTSKEIGRESLAANTLSFRDSAVDRYKRGLFPVKGDLVISSRESEQTAIEPVVSSPILMIPEKRAPLVDFDANDLNYLGATPTPTSSFLARGRPSADVFDGAGANLSFGTSPIATPNVSVGSNGNGVSLRPMTFSTDEPNPYDMRPQDTPGARHGKGAGGGGGRGNSNPSPASTWRDRYVMKFSGWKASSPDAGLPPSLASSLASNSSNGAAMPMAGSSPDYRLMKEDETDKAEAKGPLARPPSSLPPSPHSSAKSSHTDSGSVGDRAEIFSMDTSTSSGLRSRPRSATPSGEVLGPETVAGASHPPRPSPTSTSPVGNEKMVL